MKPRIYHGITVAGLGTLLLGVTAVAPAHADAYTATRNAVRRDIDAIHNDEARLSGLHHKLEDQRLHGDWRNAHGTERRITYARLDLQRDQDLLHADQRSLAHFRRW